MGICTENTLITTKVTPPAASAAAPGDSGIDMELAPAEASGARRAMAQWEWRTG